jgi:hypothetical protein
VLPATRPAHVKCEGPFVFDPDADAIRAARGGVNAIDAAMTPTSGSILPASRRFRGVAAQK